MSMSTSKITRYSETLSMITTNTITEYDYSISDLNNGGAYMLVKQGKCTVSLII